jgi:hypothetical protein
MCQTVWFEKNKNSLNLKFKPYNISCPVQTRRDSIQASEIHSELLFRYCSCYSDNRGVPTLWFPVAGVWRLLGRWITWRCRLENPCPTVCGFGWNYGWAGWNTSPAEDVATRAWSYCLVDAGAPTYVCAPSLLCDFPAQGPCSPSLGSSQSLKHSCFFSSASTPCGA